MYEMFLLSMNFFQHFFFYFANKALIEKKNPLNFLLSMSKLKINSGNCAGATDLTDKIYCFMTPKQFLQTIIDPTKLYLVLSPF